jgi:hypothetical protein
MKGAYLITAAALLLSFCSCKKDLTNGPGTTTIGKWNLVSDSTFAGVGQNNHAVDYKGQAGDYFDIRANGFMYTKEEGILDTLQYSVVSNTEIVIQSFGINANGVQATSHITNFTSNSLVIASPIALTPGGQFGRKVTLSR